MKAWMLKQAARIDALSLRERVFLFLAVLACCMALADTAWLSPAQAEHAQLSQRQARQSTELQRLRDEFRVMASPADQSKPLREELARVQAQLATVSQAVNAARLTTGSTIDLKNALVHLLRKQEGLTLVRTVALATAPLATAPAPPPSSPASRPVTVVPEDLSRQGIELSVAGAYGPLTAYVQSLEKALPQIRWGTLSLKSDKVPPELTLQLFVVGPPR